GRGRWCWRRRGAARVLVMLLASTLVLTSCGGGSSGGGGGGPPAVIVSVSPRTLSAFPTQQQQFSAAVSGTANTAVTWQVNGVRGGNASAGMVDANGLYTAPAVGPRPTNPVMVTAVSQGAERESGYAAGMLNRDEALWR